MTPQYSQALNTLQEAADKMNQTLKKVKIWFQRNKLNLNPGKTR